MLSITQPLISFAALERVFSAERIRAYGNSPHRADRLAVTRYVWNLALVAAIQPVLHSLEIAFRSELARAGGKITAKRVFRTAGVPSWLDAAPTMLMDSEYRKVLNAKERLGNDPSKRTEGRLIAKLDFGFWVALCRDSYADTRSSGPRLWPRALDLSFQKRPHSVTTRAEVFHRFDRIRKFRNRAAHHEPIWDHDYLANHEYILESLGWISPKLADALRQLSPATTVFHAGPSRIRVVYRATARFTWHNRSYSMKPREIPMSTRLGRRDVAALMDDGTAVDRATAAAFADVVRRHREAGVPMAMWEDGAVKMVSPFDIPLPGEDSADVPTRRVQGAD